MIKSQLSELYRDQIDKNIGLQFIYTDYLKIYKFNYNNFLAKSIKATNLK